MRCMITWLPKRNTERSALRRYTDWAEISVDSVPNKSASMLIAPVVAGDVRRDLDLRWIEKTQIIHTNVVDGSA